MGALRTGKYKSLSLIDQYQFNVSSCRIALGCAGWVPWFLSALDFSSSFFQAAFKADVTLVTGDADISQNVLGLYVQPKNCASIITGV